MPRVVPILLLVVIVVFALVDCIRTPNSDMPPGIPKPLWIILIVAVPVVGAIAWLIISRLPGFASSGGPRPSRPKPPRRPRGPVAPDDDPEFLANLDWQARKAYYERLRAEADAEKAQKDADPADSDRSSSVDSAADADSPATADDPEKD